MNVHKYLREQGVEFEVLKHRPTYDAQRMAQETHVSGKKVAKTVLLRADAGFAYMVVVLPADRSIDLARAGRILGGSHLELATEYEIKEHCPDCEIGALPPFGSQYGMKTIVDESFTRQDTIVFEGNSHGESIQMKFLDYCYLEHPLVVAFTSSRPKAAGEKANSLKAG